MWLIHHESPTKVGTYAYVNPVVAVFLGWIFLKEPVTPRTLLAAAATVAGVALIVSAQQAGPGQETGRAGQER